MAQHRVLRLAHDHSDWERGKSRLKISSTACPRGCLEDHFTYAIHLLLQLLAHDGFRIGDVEMGEVDENFSHVLVQHNGVNLLQVFSDDLAFVVFDDEHFFWLDHSANHNETQIGEDVCVDVFPHADGVALSP